MLKGDGKARIFKDVNETEIPALQQHLKNLTTVPRYTKAKALLNDIRDIQNSVSVYLSSEGIGASASDSLKVTFDATIKKLRSDLAKNVDEVVDDAQTLFDTVIGTRLENGAEEATKASVKKVDYFGSVMRWSTYRATLRRHGVFSGAAVRTVTAQLAASD